MVNAISMFGGSRSANGKGHKNRDAEDDLEAETGRHSKLMMPEQEETGTNELYDEIMTCDYAAFMKRMEDLCITCLRRAQGRSAGRGHGGSRIS